MKLKNDRISIEKNDYLILKLLVNIISVIQLIFNTTKTYKNFNPDKRISVISP